MAPDRSLSGASPLQHVACIHPAGVRSTGGRGGATVRLAPDEGDSVSSNRRRVEQRNVVMQLVLLGPGLLLPTGHIQVEVKQLPTQLLNGRAPGGNAPGVNIDQVRPALRQLRA